MIGLKDKLRELNLSTAGNKAELIRRLQEADPTGKWTEKDSEATGSSTTIQENRNETDVETMSIHEREIEHIAKKRIG